MEKWEVWNMVVSLINECNEEGIIKDEDVDKVIGKLEVVLYV